MTGMVAFLAMAAIAWCLYRQQDQVKPIRIETRDEEEAARRQIRRR